MIPKTIHYCWFGRKQLPPNVIKYMNSWRKYLPEFKIKEWNEDNFDVNQFEYTKEAYYAQKYAFVSDVARLWALVHEGGLYLDTDILILRPFDSKFWESKAFIGFEHNFFIGTGLIASEKKHPFFIEFLQQYTSLHFFNGLKFNEETNVNRITNFFLQKGLIQNNTRQTIDNINIYEQELFCNKDWNTNKYYNTEQSYAIHDFQSSWILFSKGLAGKISKKISEAKTIFRYKLCNL